MLSCVTLMGTVRITAASQFKIFKLHFVGICDPRGHSLNYDPFFSVWFKRQKGRKGKKKMKKTFM